jgi:hypothetical protein
VKLLAIKRGVTLKSLIEELLALEVEGEEFFEGEMRVSKELLAALEERKSTFCHQIEEKRYRARKRRKGRMKVS